MTIRGAKTVLLAIGLLGGTPSVAVASPPQGRPSSTSRLQATGLYRLNKARQRYNRRVSEDERLGLWAFRRFVRTKKLPARLQPQVFLKDKLLIAERTLHWLETNADTTRGAVSATGIFVTQLHTTYHLLGELGKRLSDISSYGRRRGVDVTPAVRAMASAAVEATQWHMASGRDFTIFGPTALHFPQTYGKATQALGVLVKLQNAK